MEDKSIAKSMSAARISVDIPVATLLPRRLLRLTSIAILPINDVIRIEYEMTPPMDPIDWAADDAAYEAWARRNDWLLSGHDDRGTAYDDWGGTRGLTPDDEKTAGERDLYPAPPSEATWLEITFHAGGHTTDGDRQCFTLRLTLPLKATSLRT